MAGLNRAERAADSPMRISVTEEDTISHFDSRVALYCHNGRSLGHTADIAKVAHLLVHDSRPSIAAITGAYHGLDMFPDEVDIIKLPSFTNFDDGSGEWNSTPRLAMTDETLHRVRAELAVTFMRHYRPDVFVVNNFARGAKDELVPTLQGHYARHHVLTLRGILFDPADTHSEFFSPAPARWTAEHFCQINIHTHPDVYRLEEFYDVPDSLARRFHYTGYLTKPPEVTAEDARERLGFQPDARVVVCSMGGGQGAGRIWRAILEALQTHRASFDAALLVTGPYLESSARRDLDLACTEMPWATVQRYRPDLPLSMRASSLFIGAAGSNMCAEVLASRCNAVLIPRQLRETEQFLHASRLQELGLVRMATLPDTLGGNLVAILREAFEAPLHPNAVALLNGSTSYWKHLPGEDGTVCSCRGSP